LFEANEQTQVIAQLRIACPLPHDTSAEAHHVEAYFCQRPSHHTVHFIAPAAPSPADDLVVARLQIHDDGTTQLHVEVSNGMAYDALDGWL